MSAPALIALMSEILDALERHTQAVQANTAAVNSMLARGALSAGRVPRGMVAEELRGLLEQLESVAKIGDRLELLRQSLTIDEPPKEPQDHEIPARFTATDPRR